MSVDLLQVYTSVTESRVQLYMCVRGLRQDREVDEQKLPFCLSGALYIFKSKAGALNSNVNLLTKMHTGTEITAVFWLQKEQWHNK